MQLLKQEMFYPHLLCDGSSTKLLIRYKPLTLPLELTTSIDLRIGVLCCHAKRLMSRIECLKYFQSDTRCESLRSFTGMRLKFNKLIGYMQYLAENQMNM